MFLEKFEIWENMTTDILVNIYKVYKVIYDALPLMTHLPIKYCDLGTKVGAGHYRCD